MSAPSTSPKRWLLAANGDLLNADYVRRIRVDSSGKIMAEVTVGADVELRASASDMAGLRQMLPMNAGGP